MKKHLLTTLSFVLIASACGDPAQPTDESTPPGSSTDGKGDIIGDDDRRDEYSTDVSDRLRELGRSTAMIVENSIISPEDDGFLRLGAETLGSSYMMCPDEAFREQLATGMCSAWLVGPDIMVTNGHCITSQLDCDSKSFVFDYALTSEDQDTNRVSEDAVIACDRVLAWDYTQNCDVDFAIIKLEREVVGRTPFEVRQAGEELEKDNLVIIGHPFGLPRKYALVGEVMGEGDNIFTTTHDIIGGNSGSGIFDEVSGKVQGLVTCGGSNFNWEYWDEGWTLDRKTGQECHLTCDEAGYYAHGAWKETCEDGQRLRCICDDNQLVWEKRPCLSFEDDTSGQCTRENRVEEFTCLSAPWLCPSPTSQHTAHFAHFIDSWQVFSRGEVLELEGSTEHVAELVVEEQGFIQAATIYLDFVGDTDPEDFNGEWAREDLEITLRHVDAEGSEIEVVLAADATINHGTAYELNNIPGATTQPLTVPFLLAEFSGRSLAGTWELSIHNGGGSPYTLHDWRVQAIAKADLATIKEYVLPCIGSDCDLLEASWPDPIHDGFDGEAVTIDDGFVTGTLAEDWFVEIMNEDALHYEVFKTRRSQTLSLSRGEFAITRDFGEDLGWRELIIDYRYDGDGWFQVWADDHIVFSKTEFAQSVNTIALPESAQRISFVLGATDDSRHHELTIYDLKISSGY